MATLPIALGRHDASASLVTQPARDDVIDALQGDDTHWTGAPGSGPWVWTTAFDHTVHLGLVRAQFGESPTQGVPTTFHWEVRHAAVEGGDGSRCDPSPTTDAAWATLPGTDQIPPAVSQLAQPTRRSFFADDEVCGLRLVVEATNAGPPVVRDVQALESARDVLRDGVASDDGAADGFEAASAIDGRYATRWVGAAGRSRWTLRVDLPQPTPIDRVRLVLGFDATSVPRAPSGRSYAIAFAPVHYSVEVSTDGVSFVPVASDPVRADGSPLPLRRRLLTLPQPSTVRALRLVMSGATGASGLPEPGAAPVVRELSAYRAGDTRPVLAAPWILSVNANPSAESHGTPGGELTNDAYWTKFLQRRFSLILPEMRRDDRYDRSLGPRGEPLDAPPHDEAGELLEVIEGDDPVLDAQLLAQSSPPPIAVLSGSDDWDYAPETGPDPKKPRRWYWDPLPGPRRGGIGQLAAAVRQRVAPFIGFCGGAQLLALLESTGPNRTGPDASPDEDRVAIDRVLRRTSGRPIRGFAPPVDLERAWPGDPPRPRALIHFTPTEPLFADVSGPARRTTTQAFPESHTDAIRGDAFLAGAPLERFSIVATSAFCGPDVVAASPRDGVFPNPSGPGWCDTVPEAFRSRDPAWPVVGMQFHAEQKDFSVPGPGDPPESVADARLVFAAAYDAMVDAYVRLAP